MARVAGPINCDGTVSQPPDADLPSAQGDPAEAMNPIASAVRAPTVTPLPPNWVLSVLRISTHRPGRGSPTRWSCRTTGVRLAMHATTRWSVTGNRTNDSGGR
jgi:hypothetical protein